MGKFDWLFPPVTPQKSKLDLYVNTPCSIRASNEDFYQTDSNNHVEMVYNKGTNLEFKLYQEGFYDYYFQHSFESQSSTLHVDLIPIPPEPPPVDDNFLYQNIDGRYGEIDKNLFENAILIEDRTIVYKWGNVDSYESNLASVCRFFTNLIWGDWISQNGFHWLDQWGKELPSATAKSLNADIAVSNLLSYTTPHSWVYSGGKDKDGIPRWPKQFAIIQELYGKPPNEVIQEKIFSKLGGSLNAWMISDGTMRIGSTIKDLFKGARLLLNNGKWNGEQLISQEYVKRTLAGGPNGNGVPFDLEGYQTHLIRNGSAWEMESELPGVPDGFMARSSKSYIIGIPSLNLIMAGKGPAQFQSVFLPEICRIMKRENTSRAVVRKEFNSILIDES